MDAKLYTLERFRYLAAAVTHSASLAQVASVRRLALSRIRRALHLDPAPRLQSIRHPLLVRPVKLWLAKPVACVAALMVYLRVVPPTRIHADGDGDLLARPPATPTSLVEADEPSHDVSVVGPFAVALVVGPIIKM